MFTGGKKKDNHSMKRTVSQKSNLRCISFGVVLQPLLLGALNLAVALLNWVITEVLWSKALH